MSTYKPQSVRMISPTKCVVDFEKDGSKVQHEYTADWVAEGVCVVLCNDRVYQQDLLDDDKLRNFDKSVGSLFWLNHQLENLTSNLHIQNIECLSKNSSIEFRLDFGKDELPVTCSMKRDGELRTEGGKEIPAAFQSEKLKTSLVRLLQQISDLLS